MSNDTRSVLDQTPAKLLLRATALWGIEELISDLGHNPRAVITEMEPDIFKQQDQFLPIGKAVQILKDASEFMKRPDLGLLLGSMQDLRVLGLLGEAIRRQPTLADAMDLVQRYMTYHSHAEVFQFEQTEEILVFRRGQQFKSTEGAPIFVEMSLSAAYSMTKDFAGQDLIPLEVRFSFAPNCEHKAYFDVFHCPVLFNCDADAIVYEASALKQENRSDFNILAQFSDAEMLAMLSTGNQNLAQEIRKLIMVLIADRVPTIDDVAEIMNVHPRKLQRELTKLGENFRHLLNEVRLDLACWYLRNSGLPISDIVNLLGYNEPASFSRSFRKATGKAPSNWRLDNQIF